MMWREEQGCSHTGVQGQPHQILKYGHEPWSLSSPCVASAMHISEVSSAWQVCNTQQHSGKLLGRGDDHVEAGGSLPVSGLFPVALEAKAPGPLICQGHFPQLCHPWDPSK